jgi:tetratricopeptide (TPR) repeat protein
VTRAAQAISMGDPARAAAEMERAVAADPLDADTAADLAHLYVRQAQPLAGDDFRRVLGDAQRAIRTARTRNPGRPVFLEFQTRLESYRCDPSLLAGEWQPRPPGLADLRKKLNSFLASRPNDPFLLNLAAQYAYQSQDYESAIRCLRRAMNSVGDGWPILWDHLADVYYRDGQTEKARECGQTFYRSRAGLFAEHGPAIDSSIERLDRMDPQDTRLRLRLAERAWQIGRADLIRRELDAALAADAALYPTSVLRLTKDELADIYLLRAKTDAAAP